MNRIAAEQLAAEVAAEICTAAASAPIEPGTTAAAYSAYIDAQIASGVSPAEAFERADKAFMMEELPDDPAQAMEQLQQFVQREQAERN